MTPIWIMIIFYSAFGNRGGVDVSVIEFSKYESCLLAKQSIYEGLNSLEMLNIKVICTQK